MGTATKIGLLFAEPYAQPLSTAAQFQAGCYIQFLTYNTSISAYVLAPVYRDPKLKWPYNQTAIPGSGPPVNPGYSGVTSNAINAVSTGVKSDATGRFDPIYLDPSINYSYTLYSASGTVLETQLAFNTPNSMLPLEAVKISATSRSVSTTPLNDPVLQLNLPSAGYYRVEADIAMLSSSGSQGALIAMAFSGTVPSTQNVLLYGYIAGAAATYITQLSTTAAPVSQTLSSVTSSVGNNNFRLLGTIQASSAGTLSFKWSPSASSNTPLSVLAGSALYATLL